MSFDKTKIYSAVNADELKAGDKVYVADSLEKLRQRVELNDTTDFFGFLELVYCEDKTFRFKLKAHDYNLAYLVERAPEKKWRPFKNIDELIDAWKGKTGVTARANTMPLIWLRNKGSNCIGSISSFGDIGVFIFGCWEYMDDLFDKYTFLDESPCGVEE